LYTAFEVQSLIHQDSELRTTAIGIFESGDFTYISPNTVLFWDVPLIQRNVGVGNGIAITPYRIGTVSGFIVLIDKSFKNVML
jgi:hypothetical protein